MKLNKDKKETEMVNDVVIPEIEEESKDISEEPKFEEKTGIVTGCSSLYVRSAPHSNASPVDVVNGGIPVKIIGEEGDFWQLEKPEGFSMKKFIKVV